MTELNYVVTVRGSVPVDLGSKIAVAHAGALQSVQKRGENKKAVT